MIDSTFERSFLAGTVITNGNEDQRVVELTNLLQVIDQATDLKVGIGQIACIHFKEACIELFLVRRQLVPGLDVRVTIGKYRIGRDHTEFLLALENLYAECIPSLVELTLVLVAPILVNLMRSMSCARCVVEKERLVRSGLLLTINEEDRLIGDLVTQVATIRSYEDRQS